ncbi:MAG: hypothetical protein HRT44_02110 [Bdellovibrionales bacterium]|nr:hypothetical protein [Bdellovibrionales bacterium]NQZ18041.1 hypothetical protein [Bdellovibrionales bacterium]
MIRLILLLIFMVNVAQAQETSAGFIEGVEAYKSKDYEKSKDIFQGLLTEYPNNPVVIFNLGLAEYSLGKKGLALGLWRKARFISPGQDEVSKAINFVETELFPDGQESGVFTTIIKWLKKVPLHLWILFCFLSLFFFIWMSITFIAKRKIPIPQWPAWQFLLIPVFLFTGFLSLYFLQEENQVSATVVASGVNTKTGPSETAPNLSALIEGELVLVEKRVDNWIQIHTMTGAPGWVESKDIIIMER